MPKVSAAQYCSHLRQLITSIGDFYGCGKKVPESVPESLSKYEIVVEQYVAIYLTLFGKQYLHCTIYYVIVFKDSHFCS